jgi:cephalosporin-C deacetylase-like acetyl esterase
MPRFSLSGQTWILDRFVRSLGIDALMPEVMSLFSSPVMGFNSADLQRIVERTRGTASMRREYERAARRREDIANAATAADHPVTARRNYHQAALFYGLAQYTIQEDGSQAKAALHARCQECYARVIQLADRPIEKVEIPFADDPPFTGASFPALLHLPSGDRRPAPCVIFIPGTDMYKEQVPNPEDNIFAKRGLACLTLDGPGQGESLLRLLKVHVETWNYERAVSAAIDYLAGRPEIDSGRIAVMGVSTGSYWAPRAAIWEARHQDRIKACAGLMADWETGFVTEFEFAQPNFKSNYMYMAGLADESRFDELAPLHTLDGLIQEVTCPVLMALGEFDELCSADQVEEIMRQVRTPHELRIYENEFHPMGGVAMEAWEGALDWLSDRLEGRPMEADVRRVIPKA